MNMTTTQGLGSAVNLTVRPACTADAPAMLAISNWAIANTTANFRGQPDDLDCFRRRLANQATHPCVVAEHAGAVIGYTLASPFHDRCGFPYVAEVSVYVLPHHAGKGVGTSLYRRLIPALAESGFRCAVAMIAAPNPASESLHRGYGFQRVGVLTGVGWKFGKWHDVGVWQLLLGEVEPTIPSCKQQPSACS